MTVVEWAVARLFAPQGSQNEMTQFSGKSIRVQSNGWRHEDTRGRLLPGRIASLLRLLDDSLSLSGKTPVCL